MDAIDLGELDDASALTLDPALWSANLTALRNEQPELADDLEQIALPAHWRAVSGLDGSPTYRLEAPGAPPQWLAATGAPRTRAGALLRGEPLAGKNPALSTIAAGAELELLLAKLGPQQAVYVFDEDLLPLAAVLRTIGVGQAIAEGRCIIVPPRRERAFLEQLLERFPGLPPPDVIVTLPGVSNERLETLRTLCDGVARQTGEVRRGRLEKLVGESRPSRAEAASPRIVLLALGPSPESHRLSRELAAASEGLGWAACRCATTGPRDIHVLPHCEQIVSFAGNLAICLGRPPVALPLRPAPIVCQWHLHAKDVPESVPSDDTVHLAATPRIAEALRTAGAEAERLRDFYWGYPQSPKVEWPSDVADRRSPAMTDETPTLLMVGDLPDASAAACRIEQPTHKQLWAQLHKTAAKAWDTAEITHTATLLRMAERASGVELGEGLLRARMCRIIEHVLIPTVVLERILALLQQDSWKIVTIGTGWQRCSSESLEPLADCFEDLPAHALISVPLAAIFAGALDPLSPATFHAAARGLPLLIHSPGGVSLARQLGGILHPQQHYEAFVGAKELRAALSALRREPQRFARRCDRTRTYLQQHHSYAQRLTSLVRELGLECQEITA